MRHQFPPLVVERLLHFVYKHLSYKRGFARYGKGTYLSPLSTWENMEFMHIGDGVTVRRGAWVSALPGLAREGVTPELTIGDGTYVGNGCVMTCARELRLGKQVVLGDNVQLGDTTHRYADLGKHLFQRGYEVGRLVVGDFAWIGRNSFVGWDLEVGEHAVIGANSVVTRSVPPYTVVAGSPARVIKRYDPESRQWCRVVGTTGRSAGSAERGA